MYKVNEQITAKIYIESGSGQTVTCTIYDENNSQFSTPTVTEIDSTGIYYANFVPDAVGQWTSLFNCAALSISRAYDYDVESYDLDNIKSDTDNLISQNLLTIEGLTTLTSSVSINGITIAANLTGINGLTTRLDNTTYGLDALSALVKQNRQGNISLEDVKATEEDATRKVAIGVTDHLILRVKADGDTDWESPISTKYLYAWYNTLGDEVPIEMKEDG